MNSNSDYNTACVVKLHNTQTGEKAYSLVFTDHGWETRKADLQREYGYQWSFELLASANIEARRVIEEMKDSLKSQGCLTTIEKKYGSISSTCFKYTIKTLQRIQELLGQKALPGTLHVTSAGQYESPRSNNHENITKPKFNQFARDALTNKWKTLFEALGWDFSTTNSEIGEISCVNTGAMPIDLFIMPGTWAVWLDNGAANNADDEFASGGASDNALILGENIKFNNGAPIIGVAKAGGVTVGNVTISRSESEFNGPEWSIGIIGADQTHTWDYETLMSLCRYSGIVGGC